MTDQAILSEPAAKPGIWWGRFRTALPLLTLALTVGILLLALNPTHIGLALSRFDVGLIVPVLVLARLYFGIQAVRWNFLLRSVGIRLRQSETQLILLAAQVASLLPFGQYARALFAERATGAEVGAVTATVLVQEITYSLMLLLMAVPGCLAHPAVAATLLTALATTLLLIVALVFPPIYHLARRVLLRLAWAPHTVPALDGLHAAGSRLLRLPATLWGSSFTVLYSALYVTLLWVIAQGVQPGSLSWTNAAFACAISHFAGAVTTLPGGLGAYEASLIGLLVVVGVDPAHAAAITILFTVADRGVGTIMGIIPYFIFERRYDHVETPAQ